MTERGATTDAALGGLPWAWASARVRDAVDRLSVARRSWLPYAGESSRLRRDQIQGARREYAATATCRRRPNAG